MAVRLLYAVYYRQGSEQCRGDATGKEECSAAEPRFTEDMLRWGLMTLALVKDAKTSVNVTEGVSPHLTILSCDCHL